LKKKLLQRISGVDVPVSRQTNRRNELNSIFPASTLSRQFTKNRLDPYQQISDTPSASFRTGRKTRNKLNSSSCTMSEAQSFMNPDGQTLLRDDVSTSMLSTPSLPLHDPSISTLKSSERLNSPMESQKL
jgi:hypothetical protein